MLAPPGQNGPVHLGVKVAVRIHAPRIRHVPSRLPGHQHAKPRRPGKRQRRGCALLGHVHHHFTEPRCILAPAQRGEFHPRKIPQLLKTPGIPVQGLLRFSVRHDPGRTVHGKLADIFRRLRSPAFQRGLQGRPETGPGTHVRSHHAKHLLPIVAAQPRQTVHGAHDVRNAFHRLPIHLHGREAAFRRRFIGHQAFQPLPYHVCGFRQAVPVIQRVGDGPAPHLLRHEPQILRPAGNGLQSPFVRLFRSPRQGPVISLLV